MEKINDDMANLSITPSITEMEGKLKQLTQDVANLETTKRTLEQQIVLLQQDHKEIKAFVEDKKESIKDIPRNLKSLPLETVVKNDGNEGYIYILCWKTSHCTTCVIKVGYTVQEPVRYITRKYQPQIYEVLALEKVKYPKTVEKLLIAFFTRRYTKWTVGREWFLTENYHGCKQDMEGLNLLVSVQVQQQAQPQRQYQQRKYRTMYKGRRCIMYR